MSALPVVDLKIDYEEDLTRIKTFLNKFKATARVNEPEEDENRMEDEDVEEQQEGLKYHDQLVSTLYITAVRCAYFEILATSCEP